MLVDGSRFSGLRRGLGRGPACRFAWPRSGWRRRGRNFSARRCCEGLPVPLHPVVLTGPVFCWWAASYDMPTFWDCHPPGVGAPRQGARLDRPRPHQDRGWTARRPGDGRATAPRGGHVRQPLPGSAPPRLPENGLSLAGGLRIRHPEFLRAVQDQPFLLSHYPSDSCSWQRLNEPTNPPAPVQHSSFAG